MLSFAGLISMPQRGHRTQRAHVIEIAPQIHGVEVGQRPAYVGNGQIRLVLQRFVDELHRLFFPVLPEEGNHEVEISIMYHGSGRDGLASPDFTFAISFQV